MKTIVRNSAFGLVALLALVWVSAPTPANALATCSTVPKPIMTIAISGYGTFSNSANNLDAVGSITVPYGTALSATFSNRSIAADTYTLIDSWPGGSQTWNHINPGSRVHATGALTANTSFNIYVSTACSPDPLPGPQEGPDGSVHVDVIVQAAPAPTATLTASPNPVNSGSPTTLTWTSTNATSCTATGGAGFSTGNATGGSDASSNLTSQTTFSMSCTGAGGTVTKSVTVGVNAAPTCSVSPASAAPGATVVATAAGGTSGSYTWNTGGGSACAAGGTCSTSYGTAGSKTITVTRNGLSSTCNVTVTTPAPTATLTASPNPVNSGSPTTLTWTSTNATSCTATGGSGFSTGSATSGSDASSNLTTQTTFSMTCTGAGGTVSKSVTVSVNAPLTTPSCSVNPLSAATGETVRATATGGTSGAYTWSTGGGTACAAGTTCDTSYTTTGSKTITVTRNGLSSTCPVTITTLPVNGDCGSAENGTFATAPTTNLCDAGGATSVSGGSMWTWSCVGVNGGTTASCDAAVTASPVTCSGPIAGQTGVSYTFTGSGASSYTWAISPTSGVSAPTSGSGSSVTKSFSTAGSRTITFTSGSNSDQCTIDITTTPPSLYFDLSASPTVVNVGQTATLSWTSAGADRIDNLGSSPADEAWVGGSEIADAGSATVSPLVRTTYSGRGVRYSPVGQASDTAIIQVRPQCLPAGQTVALGQTATLTAAGGNGTYAWTATGGSPASGTGSSFSTSYATAGTRTVSLGSDSLTTNCTVTVSPPAATGTIVVNSVNAQGEAFLTTWSLSGPPGGSQTQSSPSAGKTYTNIPVGLYTLSAGVVDGYTAVITPTESQDLTEGITRTFTITYTDAPTPVEEVWVDLRANPTSVNSGEASTLTWTSDGIEPGTCVASGDWEKTKDDQGSESTGALTADATYTITCDAPQVQKGDPATVSDTANVSVILGDDDDGTPDCSDGVNNDAGDELIDYPADPGCYGDEDPSEEDVPAPGDDDDVIIGACNDGFDNDGDGTIDGADSGCANGDDTEQSEPDIREI